MLNILYDLCLIKKSTVKFMKIVIVLTVTEELHMVHAYHEFSMKSCIHQEHVHVFSHSSRACSCDQPFIKAMFM